MVDMVAKNEFVNSIASYIGPRTARFSVTRKETRKMARKSLTKGVWSRDDLKQLRRLFPAHPTAEVATHLGRPTEAVKKKASRMGLRKSRNYMRSLGRK